jgi:4-hydroxybenzoate polyprenyltransferase
MGIKIIPLVKSAILTIRPVNLVIICLSLYLTRYFLIKPVLSITGADSSLTDKAYMLMVFSVVLVAAAGYIINDYFDVSIDNINKPDRNYIQNTITPFAAKLLYLLLVTAALVAAFIFGKVTGIRYLLLIVVVSAFLLFTYAAYFKTRFLIGNLVVSFLSGLTILLSILCDRNALHAQPLFLIIGSYSVFAFMMTLIREIVKDCQDIVGDQEYGASTIPITFGLKAARITAAFLTAIVFSALLYIQVVQSQWEDTVSFAYVVLFIQLPLILLAISILKANSSRKDYINSMISKGIMITGILSIVVFYFSW